MQSSLIHLSGSFLSANAEIIKLVIRLAKDGSKVRPPQPIGLFLVSYFITIYSVISGHGSIAVLSALELGRSNHLRLASISNRATSTTIQCPSTTLPRRLAFTFSIHRLSTTSSSVHRARSSSRRWRRLSHLRSALRAQRRLAVVLVTTRRCLLS